MQVNVRLMREKMVKSIEDKRNAILEHKAKAKSAVLKRRTVKQVETPPGSDDESQELNDGPT